MKVEIYSAIADKLQRAVFLYGCLSFENAGDG